MPRTTKDDAEKKEKIAKIATTTKTTKQKTTKQSKITKKVENNKSQDKPKKTSNTTKAVVKKDTKKTTSKKVAPKTASSSTKKKESATKLAKTKKVQPVSVIEYYDLPYRYNQTIVKILAQTPQMLFVYWDISDKDRNLFIKQYGDHFFSETKPVLLIHNETMNYTFEIEINDFANSWYLHVNDTNCKYKIELGRRPHSHISTISDNYIHVTHSNQIESPNDHILFETFDSNVEFTNIKTGKSSTKDFSNLSNYKNMQQIYHIYDLYKNIYKDEIFEEILTNGLNNPSSGGSSRSN